MKKNIGILVCAGQGVRFNASQPKQFCLLKGKEIYLHTLEVFLSCPLFEQIIIATSDAWIEKVKEQTGQISEAISVISGGATRQESVYKALKSCPENTEIVVIHDAVRPFITSRVLLDHVEKARLHHAVDTCIPCTDTLIYSTNGQFIEDVPNRDHYFRGQTPQSFSYPLILEAHEKALDLGILNATDDCQLALKFGHQVYIYHGENSNIKITNPIDLQIAEQLLTGCCFIEK